MGLSTCVCVCVFCVFLEPPEYPRIAEDAFFVRMRENESWPGRSGGQRVEDKVTFEPARASRCCCLKIRLITVSL